MFNFSKCKPAQPRILNWKELKPGITFNDKDKNTYVVGDYEAPDGSGFVCTRLMDGISFFAMDFENEKIIEVEVYVNKIVHCKDVPEM